jgi:hypothetical protein
MRRVRSRAPQRLFCGAAVLAAAALRGRTTLLCPRPRRRRGGELRVSASAEPNARASPLGSRVSRLAAATS